MRRAQATLEALFALLLLGIVLAAGLTAAQRGYEAARVVIDAAVAPAAVLSTRRGQAMVEVVVLIPLLVAVVTVLVAGWVRLGDVVRAERALAVAQAAIVAGEPVPAVGERWNASVVRRGDRLVVRVPSPLVDVVIEADLPTAS